MTDETCYHCGRKLWFDDFGFLCNPCEAQRLKSLGLSPALHRSDAVAHSKASGTPVQGKTPRRKSGNPNPAKIAHPGASLAFEA